MLGWKKCELGLNGKYIESLKEELLSYCCIETGWQIVCYSHNTWPTYKTVLKGAGKAQALGFAFFIKI